MFIERIFALVGHHPFQQDRAAAADHMGLARIFTDALQRHLVQSGVDGHEIGTVFGMLDNRVEKVVEADIGDRKNSMPPPSAPTPATKMQWGWTTGIIIVPPPWPSAILTSSTQHDAIGRGLHLPRK